MKTIILYTLILLNFYNKINFTNEINFQQKPNNINVKNKEIKPDLKINNLEIVNPNSIIKNIGDLKKYLENSKMDLPSVTFFNNNKSIKITLVTFPGSSYNDVYQFIIENNDSKIVKKEKVLKYDDFITENGIKLGITKEEIVKIKGSNFKLKKNNDCIVLSYIINDYKKSDFLKRYNMPSYFMEYTIKNDILIKFKFGFDYP